MAGRKPGDHLTVRKRRTGTEEQVPRCTLGDVLSNIAPDFNQLNYCSEHQGGLKMVFTRASTEWPPKPEAAHSGTEKPFQLIEMQGNIRKCFSCGLPLKDAL